jgi:hypothetical protein
VKTGQEYETPEGEETMKRLIVAGLVFWIAGCGGGDGGQQPSVNATGTWTGVIPSVNQANSPTPPGLPTSVTINLSQSGASVSGNYSASTGAFGDIAGTISGHTAKVTITLTSQNCSGTLTGTGEISKPVTGPSPMDFHVSGFSTCGGNENDTANLTQISIPALSKPYL